MLLTTKIHLPKQSKKFLHVEEDRLCRCKLILLIESLLSDLLMKVCVCFHRLETKAAPLPLLQ